MAEGGSISFRHEMIRKTIHLMSMAIPIGYCLFTRKVVLIGTGFLLGIALAVEILRFSWPTFTRWFNSLAGPLLRPHEFNGLTGSTYLLLGYYFSIHFFDKWIAIAAILFLCVSDALSGLVGRKWGRIAINRGRTLEGSFVFITTAMIIIVLLPGLAFIAGLAGVITGLLIDILVRNINDNLSIPLGSGLIMQIVSWIVSN
jgi:dolichol kinase